MAFPLEPPKFVIVNTANLTQTPLSIMPPMQPSFYIFHDVDIAQNRIVYSGGPNIFTEELDGGIPSFILSTGILLIICNVDYMNMIIVTCFKRIDFPWCKPIYK